VSICPHDDVVSSLRVPNSDILRVSSNVPIIPGPTARQVRLAFGADHRDEIAHIHETADYPEGLSFRDCYCSTQAVLEIIECSPDYAERMVS